MNYLKYLNDHIMKAHPIQLLLLAGFMFAACQDDEMPKQPVDDTPVEEQTSYTVEVMDNSFSPESLTISEGDTVIWINKGSSTHTSTSGTDCEPDEIWNSGNLPPEESFSFVFTSRGTFDYFCIPHCEMGMTGSITVEE